MSRQKLKNILSHEFRAHPGYEAVGWESLSPEERKSLANIKQSPDFFGILRPINDSGLNIKSTCKNTAHLFSTLKEPGSLPKLNPDNTDAKLGEQIAELVLEDVLQIASPEGFLSGAAAQDTLYEGSQTSHNPGRLARLSHDAISHAARLPWDDPIQLSNQIYFYNRSPVTPRWKSRIGRISAYEKFLGIDPRGVCAPILQKYWNMKLPAPDERGWRSWSLKSARESGRAGINNYKIYLSPTLEALPEALPILVETLTEKGTLHFKIGPDLPGLVRPDKIVAYFDSFDEVEEVGQILSDRLSGIPAQGVPFTADLGRDGLLSWGMDPDELPIFDWLEAPSWRLWITHRLALSILTAKRTPDTSPVEFALDRLNMDGIDTESWTPLATFRERIAS